MNAGARLAFAALLFSGLSSPALFAGEALKDIQGELADSDPADKVFKKPHQVHTVNLDAGKAVIVDLESTDFDPLLRLEDSAGQTIAFDDDGGEELNSRAVLAATEKGAYKIIASSLKGIGKYTIKFRPAEAVLAMRGNLNQAIDVHNIKLKPGTLYIISLVSKDFDTFVRLEDAKGDKLAENDDTGFDLNSMAGVQPTKEAVYKLIVTSFGGTGRGAYDVRVIAAKDVAVPMPFVGGTMKGQLAATDPRDLLQRKSPCKLYLVTMNKGQVYTIDLQSKDFDAFLRIESPEGQPLKVDDDGGGDLNSRIVFTPTKDGAYKVYATSLAGGTGAFTLQVQEAKTKVALSEKGNLKDKTSTHKFKAVSGKQYIIDVTSDAFDTLIKLNDTSGNEIANDDDGGDGLNSRIAFTAKADGVHEIIVTSFDGDGRGNYMVAIQESESAKKSPD